MDNLNLTFSALSDPTRRAILERLSLGELSVNELAEPFDISLPAVSKHLKVLEKAGLISRSRTKQWRPCALETQPLQDLDNWLKSYRHIWENRLGYLEDYLKTLKDDCAI